mmetsp:Transcript_6943/g.20788  ORF Transcript_6943/g.20788 Transcript_6943/m.20788 type:complete len:236 (-) Transcript_6943:82-789(-)
MDAPHARGIEQRGAAERTAEVPEQPVPSVHQEPIVHAVIEPHARTALNSVRGEIYPLDDTAQVDLAHPFQQPAELRGHRGRSRRDGTRCVGPSAQQEQQHVDLSRGGADRPSVVEDAAAGCVPVPHALAVQYLIPSQRRQVGWLALALERKVPNLKKAVRAVLRLEARLPGHAVGPGGARQEAEMGRRGRVLLHELRVHPPTVALEGRPRDERLWGRRTRSRVREGRLVEQAHGA